MSMYYTATGGILIQGKIYYSKVDDAALNMMNPRTKDKMIKEGRLVSEEKYLKKVAPELNRDPEEIKVASKPVTTKKAKK